MFFNLKNYRSLLKLSGSDTNSFLQRVISNDMNLLDYQPIIYALILTPQGKLLFDLFIFRDQNNYFLDIASNNKQDVLDIINKYKLSAEFNIEDLSEKYDILYSSQHVENKDNYFFNYTDPRCNSNTRIYIPKTRFDDFVNKYNVSFSNDYNIFRIKNILPEIGTDISPGQLFPLDCNLEELNAISFTKGCYVGQEVTNRVKIRNKVRKKLFYIFGEYTIKIYDEIIYNDKKVGNIIFAQDNHALAQIKFLDVNMNNLFISNNKINVTQTS